MITSTRLWSLERDSLFGATADLLRTSVTRPAASMGPYSHAFIVDGMVKLRCVESDKYRGGEELKSPEIDFGGWNWEGQMQLLIAKVTSCLNVQHQYHKKGEMASNI